MKLLYCLSCHDIRALAQYKRTCVCKKTSGKYVNDYQMVTDGKVLIAGPAVVLGIPTADLEKMKPYSGETPLEMIGSVFCIASDASTVNHVKASEVK